MVDFTHYVVKEISFTADLRVQASPRVKKTSGQENIWSKPYGKVRHRNDSQVSIRCGSGRCG